jgi:hypothetical protein
MSKKGLHITCQPFLNFLMNRYGSIHMVHVKKYRWSLVTGLTILCCLVFFTRCMNSDDSKPVDEAAAGYAAYAGSAACVSCHKDIYNSHIKTAHLLTSQTANAQTIKGSFEKGKNQFVFNEKAMVAMEKTDSGFYQVAYINGIEKKRQRFDLVIGSGTKGQSFASWTGNNLFQLPVTYFTSANAWCNSPGYPGKIAFNRPITSRCLECHATYAEKLSVQNVEPEAYNKGEIILGVDCEQCHGPAKDHVEFQTQNPTVSFAKFIINPAKFNRQQSLDMCALCHGGRLQKTKPSFSFIAGKNLADYFIITAGAANTDNIDVHGNQYGLLKASKCFLKSNTLTCVSCHNSHENEKGKTALFVQRCLSCHNNQHADAVNCKMTASLGADINTYCINCHMPEQPSMAIAVMLQGNPTPTPALMHTHLIKNYPEETKAILELIKKKKTVTK